jgi:ATP-binding cassette subfamily B protein
MPPQKPCFYAAFNTPKLFYVKEQTTKLNTAFIKRILSFAKPYRWIFVVSLVFTLSVSALAIIRPLLISKALNDSVMNHPDVQNLNSLCLTILLFLLLEAVLQISVLRLTNLLGQNIVKDLRNKVYQHILHLKNTYFDNTPVGTLVTRAVSDIESLSDMFAQGFIVIAGDMVMLCIFITAMVISNWMLALISLSTIPLLFAATSFFKRGVKKSFTQVRNAVAALNTFTQEHITGMRLVQLFNREDRELTEFKEINKQHRDANIRSIFYYSVFFPLVEILSSISIALLIWFIGQYNHCFHISLGDITFFVMMVNMMFRPIRMLADRLNTLQMGFVSAERVFKVLDTNESIENTGTIPFEKVRQNISFQHLYFAYVSDQYVLKDISFDVKAGETVALVGATGAGKSSIINLLSRFYEFNRGDIHIDNTPIKDYDLASLRRNTGVVLQDVYLFNDTVFNNVTLNNPDISLAQVEEATLQIGLYDFITSLPGGFHYQVTERGQSLSAGQRQLIAFIRAYVYRPSIFILDEATATIDTQTEQLLQTATKKISSGRTSIIIAHRLSTIKDVNNILVFEKGEIIEQGNMQALMSRNSKFKKLYELQAGTEQV